MVGRILFIPDTYLISVSGALEKLADIWEWEKSGDELPQDAADRMAAMIGDYYMSSVALDTNERDRILPLSHFQRSPEKMAVVLDSNQFPGWYWHFSILAVNVALSWELGIEIGQYYLDIWTEQSSNQGIISFIVDGATIDTLDTYHATVVRQINTQSALFTINTTNPHTIQLKMATKNASSSNYDLRISAAVLVYNGPP